MILSLCQSFVFKWLKWSWYQDYKNKLNLVISIQIHPSCMDRAGRNTQIQKYFITYLDTHNL